MRRLAWNLTLGAAAVAISLGGGAVWAVTPPELEGLFPRRAEIAVGGEGLARLVLPPEVLAACRSDLSDLRIVTFDGEEVPYLIDGGPPPETTLEAETRLALRIREAQQAITTRESGPDLFSETYSLDVPEEARGGGAWELVIAAPARRFVRAVEVVALAADGSEKYLAEGVSIFRLPEAGQEKSRLRLAPLTTETFTVTLTGEDSGFLEPTFALESSRTLAAADRAVVGLEIAELRPPREGRSRLELARPRGVVPDLIRLDTSTPSFSRRVEVWDEGPGAGTEPLGAAELFRIETAAGVESLELRLRPARGDRLRVVIDDGDSPPLRDLAFEAVLRRPALLFSLPPETSRARLLFGGGRAYRPRYDLSGLLPPSPGPVAGERARIAEQLYDPGSLAAAAVGPAEANPAFDPTPALTFAMDPGAEIDPRPFRHRVGLRAGEAPEGLFKLRVTPSIAALARDDLGDLRVVDAANRQIAYLLEPDAARVELPLEIGPPETKDGTSSYRLSPPFEPVVVDQVILDSEKEFFDRAYELVGVPAGAKREEVVVARGRLVRLPADPRPLRIDCRRQRLSALELRVTDRDDAPLAFFDASLRVPSADLYFASPGGDYSLLLGNPDESAPRYELARVRDVVLAVESTPVEAAEVGDNPAFSAGAWLGSATGLQEVVLWGALIVAVVVLAWLTLRLTRD